MSYTFYKVLHLVAVFAIFLSIGGAVVRSLVADSNMQVKKVLGILFGSGLLIALIAGFGLMAKLGIAFDGWIVAKLVIWLILGGLPAVLNRKPGMATQVGAVALILGCIAAYLALTKPF